VSGPDNIGARASPTRDQGTSSTKSWLRALEMTTPIARYPSRIFPSVIEELAERFGDAPALISERECMTYRELAGRSNQYSRWALAQGLAKGECVCLFMPNRPEYLAIWLGVSRIGGVTSLVNTNLTGPSLAHCIEITEPKHIIVASELMEVFSVIRHHLSTNAKIWVHGESVVDSPRIDSEIRRYQDQKLAKIEQRPITIRDWALYIFTSGTTGLPKAANVSHYRVMLWAYWFAGMLDTQSGDRMYDCLPMYHSVGGVVAPGAVLVNGGSVVIRDKFSARQFWDDIVHWDCTLFQYIGELCRYLVNSETHPREKQHRIRACCGNGLRPDVWNDFKTRFCIPQILEFYAATEGNVSLYNVEGKPGAIGRIPRFLAHRFPLAIVKYDVENELPFRDDQGFCTRCAPGEIGEAISKISIDPAEPGSRFEGYTDRKESKRKILRDVFEQGDAWYRTGDLMRKDASGYFYFVDRIGDTFRWKGENVATTEVFEVIMAFPGIKDAVVYGVAIPAHDGCAGMAALVAGAGFDLAAFREHLVRHLPAYAQPSFVRICDAIQVTATFKQQKTEFVRLGYGPSKTTDPIYFNDSERGAFVPLDKILFERIQTGQVRI
jgi:fatty-acyl-CoA synthase